MRYHALLAALLLPAAVLALEGAKDGGPDSLPNEADVIAVEDNPAISASSSSSASSGSATSNAGASAASAVVTGAPSLVIPHATDGSHVTGASSSILASAQPSGSTNSTPGGNNTGAAEHNANTVSIAGVLAVVGAVGALIL